MNVILKLVLFLSSNLLGMWMHAITFWIVMTMGLRDFNADPSLLQFYSLQVIGTWAICALFSFSFFFLKSKMRYFFLLAPTIIPFFFGLIAPVFY